MAIKGRELWGQLKNNNNKKSKSIKKKRNFSKLLVNGSTCMLEICLV